MRRHILAISIIVIFALSVAQLASAADEIGTTIELYEEPAEEPILASKTFLMLQITFTNPTEDWVSFSSLGYTLKVTHTGKEVQGGNTITTMHGNFYIPPADTHTLYIPLSAYNDLSEDERVGSWAVYFTVENQEDVRWYQKNLLSQFLIRPNLQTTANPLEFKVIQPTLEVSGGTIQDRIIDFFGSFSILQIITGIVSGLIVVVMVSAYALRNKLSGKSKR